jgi:hypothetical protein
MLLGYADAIPLLQRVRSSHGKMARLFATLAILPFTGGATVVQAAQEKPILLTFAQLAACPLTGLVFQDPAKSPLTESIRSATGKQVVVTGYMLPLVMEKGRARELLLMRNTMGCCYGQTPAANEYLVIKINAPGLPVTMDIPVALQGTLRVAPVVMGGMVVEFYHLDNAELAPR